VRTASVSGRRTLGQSSVARRAASWSWSLISGYRVLQRQWRAFVAAVFVVVAGRAALSLDGGKVFHRDIAGNVAAVEARGLEASSLGFSAPTTRFIRIHVLVDQRIGADVLADLLDAAVARSVLARGNVEP